jgi:hypothetical protein
MKQPFMTGGGPTSRQRQEVEPGPLLRLPIVKAVTNVTNSNVTLWTVTAGKFLYVQDFGVCNIAGATIAVTVYVVASGGAAGATNKVYDAYPVLANDSGTLTALIGGIYEPGTAIIAVTDNATGANFWLSGYEAIGGDFLS